MTSTVSRIFLVCAAATLGALAGPARAGDDAPPAPKETNVDQAHCQAMGEGYFAVKGSTSCIKISGYISVGGGAVDFGGRGKKTEGSAPSHVVGFTENSTGVSIETRFDSELGPGRIYVEINGTNLNAFSGGPAHPLSPAADR
jgi:hypothetical protein